MFVHNSVRLCLRKNRLFHIFSEAQIIKLLNLVMLSLQIWWIRSMGCYLLWLTRGYVCVHMYKNKTGMRIVPILGNAIKQVKNEVNKNLKS